MQGKYGIYRRAFRLVAPILAAIALGALLLCGPGVGAGEVEPAAALHPSHLSNAQAEPTPVPSPSPLEAPALEDPAVAAQCAGMDCTITSGAGWQRTPLTLKQGEQFSIAYLGGTWTVDKRKWPYVGPEGYTPDVDRQIGYPACKLKGDSTFATLLGRVGEGPAIFVVGRGGTFTADRDGSLYLAINDRVCCQGDNDGCVTVRLAKPSCARLSVVPSYQEIRRGDRGTTKIQVTDVTRLYGIQFQFNFDPNIVQVVDADQGKEGIQISVGSLFKSKQIFVARNTVNNATGVGEFVVTLVGSETPINGSGPLAVITWQGKNGGRSPVTLTLTGLAPASQPICHTIENGSIQVLPEPTVSGRVLLQGGQDHSGTNVFLAEGPRTCTSKICSQELSNVPLDVTDREGRFEISPMPGRSYPWLWAYHACYLTGAKQGPQGELGTLTLLAGDVNEDDCVTVHDLTAVGYRLGKSDHCADYTQNGVVDIFDLVLAAKNLGKCGPVCDWEK